MIRRVCTEIRRYYNGSRVYLSSSWAGSRLRLGSRRARQTTEDRRLPGLKGFPWRSIFEQRSPKTNYRYWEVRHRTRSKTDRHPVYPECEVAGGFAGALLQKQTKLGCKFYEIVNYALIRREPYTTGYPITPFYLVTSADYVLSFIIPVICLTWRLQFEMTTKGRPKFTRYVPRMILWLTSVRWELHISVASGWSKGNVR